MKKVLQRRSLGAKWNRAHEGEFSQELSTCLMMRRRAPGRGIPLPRRCKRWLRAELALSGSDLEVWEGAGEGLGLAGTEDWPAAMHADSNAEFHAWIQSRRRSSASDDCLPQKILQRRGVGQSHPARPEEEGAQLWRRVDCAFQGSCPPCSHEDPSPAKRAQELCGQMG